MEKSLQTVILAGGCFWCTEAIFKSLRGVNSVIPGYSGGKIDNPTYEQVSNGESGHAEAVKIEFDSNIISFKDLLYVFFKLHDPTELNRQGADVGTQYRSEIFYTTDQQKDISESVMAELKTSFPNPIVTKITKYTNFFPAEDYHRDYYFKNTNNPYCKIVIDPKIQKLKKEFGHMLK
jgi:peptide-methionine (S)-S-oxide reductase